MVSEGLRVVHWLLWVVLWMPGLCYADSFALPLFEQGLHEQAWFRFHLYDLIPGAICCGVLLVVALYKLSIYWHSRKLSFLYHSLYSCAVFVLAASALGVLPALFPSTVKLNNEIMLVSGALATIFIGLFGYHRLRKIELHPWLDIGAKAVGIFSVLSSLSIVLPWHSWASILVCASALLVSLCLVAIAIWLWRNQNDNGISYIVAWCCVSLGLVLTLMLSVGWLSWPIYPHIPLSIGLLIEVLIVTFSLAASFADAHSKLVIAHASALKSAEEAKALQKLAEEAQELATEELESKVQERTFELEVTLREMEEVNQKLEEQSTMDFLTGVKNRKHFDKRYLAETRRSRREQTPLSVMMLDIDHFKSVNDTYGHLVGDECIRQVAHQIQAAIKRPTDVLTRYGGEEFAVILPSTPKEGAMLVAEEVIAAVRKTSILTAAEQPPLSVTISAGVSTAVIQPNSEPEQLLAAADQALYHAKQSGRDQAQFQLIAELTPDS